MKNRSQLYKKDQRRINQFTISRNVGTGVKTSIRHKSLGEKLLGKLGITI